MLFDISAVNERVQTCYLTRAACSDDIKGLYRDIDRAKNWSGTSLHGCNLGTNGLHESLHLTADADFEQGSVKLPRKRTNQLTDVVDKAISLMLRGDGASKSAKETDEDAPPKMQLRKKCKTDESERCIFPAFILGSSVEVERFWSVLKHVLSGARCKMKSLLLEAIVLSEYSSHLWGVQLVAEAVGCSIAELSKERHDKVEKYIAFYSQFED